MYHWLTVHSAILSAPVIAVCTCAPVALRHAECLNVFRATRSGRQWRRSGSSHSPQQGWEGLKLFKGRQNPHLVTVQSVREKASLSAGSPESTDAILFTLWPFKLGVLLERTTLFLCEKNTSHLQAFYYDRYVLEANLQDLTELSIVKNVVICRRNKLLFIYLTRLFCKRILHLEVWNPEFWAHLCGWGAGYIGP